MKKSDRYIIPARFKWALDVIQPKPSDEILEIGCGSGTLAAMIAAKLTTGRLTVIDRSPSMIRTAKKRNAQFITTGKTSIIETSLEDWEPTQTFDKVVAFNVSLFWNKPKQFLPLVKQLLNPDGRFFAFHQPPKNTTEDDMYVINLVFDINVLSIEDILVKKMQPTPSGCIITTL